MACTPLKESILAFGLLLRKDLKSETRCPKMPSHCPDYNHMETQGSKGTGLSDMTVGSSMESPMGWQLMDLLGEQHRKQVE